MSAMADILDTGTQDLLAEREGGVVWLTFNRPQARNAVTFAMYDGLAQACDQIAADESVHAVILRGAGGAFAAGTDISQFRTFATADDALAYERRFENAVGKLENLPRPVIAAVRGDAVGGGAALLLACDLRVCTPQSRFGVPIARTLGNCLSIRNTARLVEAVGSPRAAALLFTGDLANAHDALAAGLVNEIAEDPETRAKEIAARIAQNAPMTVRVAKEAIRRIVAAQRPPQDDALVLKAYLSEDFHEGVAAFLEKRKPRWKGK